MASRELVKVRLVNCRPLSETTSDGIPNLQFERKASVSVAASIYARGTALSQRVSLSQMVKR